MLRLPHQGDKISDGVNEPLRHWAAHPAEQRGCVQTIFLEVISFSPPTSVGSPMHFVIFLGMHSHRVTKP